MNITEANATVRILRALGTDWHDDPDQADLLADARFLAERAAKPLLVTADHILRSNP